MPPLGVNFVAIGQPNARAQALVAAQVDATTRSLATWVTVQHQPDIGSWSTSTSTSGRCQGRPRARASRNHDVLRDVVVVDATRVANDDPVLDQRRFDVHEPVFYGPDAEAVYDIVCSMSSTRQVLASIDGIAAELALTRLRRLLVAHETSQGVEFDSRAWIVTAKRGRPDDLLIEGDRHKDHLALFDVDLLRTRTRERMAVARGKGKLRGKQPRLSPK